MAGFGIKMGSKVKREDCKLAIGQVDSASKRTAPALCCCIIRQKEARGAAKRGHVEVETTRQGFELRRIGCQQPGLRADTDGFDVFRSKLNNGLQFSMNSSQCCRL